MARLCRPKDDHCDQDCLDKNRSYIAEVEQIWKKQSCGGDLNCAAVTDMQSTKDCDRLTSRMTQMCKKYYSKNCDEDCQRIGRIHIKRVEDSWKGSALCSPTGPAPGCGQ